MVDNREIKIDTINNDAYLLSCQCPACKTYLKRDYDEDVFYCFKCGQKVRTPAFSEEEIKEALFQHRMDKY